VLLLSTVAALSSAVSHGQAAVWDLPAGAKPTDLQKRKGWKPAGKGSRFAGGAVMENDAVAVCIVPGARGVVLRGKGAGPVASIELRVLDKEEKSAPIRRVEWVPTEDQEVALGFETGNAKAQCVLAPDTAHVEIRPGKNAEQLQVLTRARYALLPKFVEEDLLYDPMDASPVSIEETSGNMLLHLLGKGNAISALLWKPGERKEGDADDGDGVKAEILADGKGAARRYTTTHVRFSGRSVWAALLQGKQIWHSVSLRTLAGASTSKIGWKRPFKAKWRVNFRVQGFRKKQVEAFLKTAAELKLSAGHEKEWKREYSVLEGDKDTLDLFGTECFYFRNAKRDGRLPRSKPDPDAEESFICPAVFRGKEALLTPRAQWPCFPDPTRKRLQAVQKQRTEKGQAPLYPIHWYGYAVIFPADGGEDTPLEARTALDVMRDALGSAPCDLSWLEELEKEE
jgi:hypothetical protein